MSGTFLDAVDHKGHPVINQKLYHWRLREQHDRLIAVVNLVENVLFNDEIRRFRCKYPLFPTGIPALTPKH